VIRVNVVKKTFKLIAVVIPMNANAMKYVTAVIAAKILIAARLNQASPREIFRGFIWRLSLTDQIKSELIQLTKLIQLT
jgi:hypothetical protein